MKRMKRSWRVAKNIYGEPMVITGKKSVIAIIKSPSIFWSADTNLISAAPELLKALQRLLNCTQGEDDSLAAAQDQAMEIIAKATGEKEEIK